MPIVEIGLLLIFLVHVYKTIAMYFGNKRARPVGYAKKRYAGPPSRKSVASSTMIFSGLWLLVFIVIHVKTFKYGPEYEALGAAGVRDLYRVEMENFANPLTVGFYVLSMLVVGSHLWHGISSGFQSLGADHPRRTPRLIVAGRVIAVLIAGGFIAIALWAYAAGAGHDGRQSSRGAHHRQVGPAQVRDEAGQPGQQAQVHDHRRRHRAGRRVGGRVARRAGLQRPEFLHSGQPRRAHSIAAQGGINAAKNYRNDGDSVYRLFYDTVKGGDYRSREANVYRLAQLSVNIIDQCVAQGVPFAREYGGLLDNRSFGGAQVSRTFYARGQTGQQLLLGAYQALMRQVRQRPFACFPGARCWISC